MFRVYGCVFCSISLLFAYMCIRMPSSPGSIVEVGRLLLGFPITAHHLCAFGGANKRTLDWPKVD